MVNRPVREVAIIGAGNGGCAAAADLTLRGFNVRLYGRRAEAIAPIRERGAIELSGVLGEHVVPVAQVTNDAGAADCRRRPRDPDGADPRPRGHGGGRGAASRSAARFCSRLPATRCC